MAFDALGVQLTLNDHLRGNPCVVGTWLPEGIFAQHSVIAGERVHDGIVKAMPHVQWACDIGRWQGNRKRLLFIIAWLKVAFVFPHLVHAVFDVAWVVSVF